MLRSLLSLLAMPFLLSAQAAPARDITAIYVNDAGRETSRLEIAADGDLRISSGADSYWLWHDGQAYLVNAGPGGPTVVRIADIAAARVDAGPAKPSEDSGPRIELVAGGATSINGRRGTLYTFRGGKNSDPAWFPVYSSDPALMPIARALAREAAVSAVMRNGGPDSDAFDKMLAVGVPLKIGGTSLKTVTDAAIPATRFALPAEPEPSALVRTEWRSIFAPESEAGSAADDAAFSRQTFKRAIFAGAKLWLLSDLGKLTIVDPATKAATERVTPAPVLDMCRGDAGPVLLTGSKNQPVWTLMRQREGGWQDVATIATAGDGLIAMTCSGDRVTVLTAKRLIDVSPMGQRAVALKIAHPVGGPLITATVYDAGDALLLGVNSGEWGGGLRRIDRATGTMSLIQKVPGEPCDGPLGASCDPVNGIAAMPGRPGCVVVAVGMVHMMSRGRLVRICGSDIAAIYYKPYTIEPWKGYDPAVPEPFNTVAFFGLTRGADALWAVGTDGIYRIGEGGALSFRKMPAFEQIGGIWVSFAISDLVLVRTTINQRASLSGAVPMLVPRG